MQSGLVKLRDEERPESDVYDRFRGRLMFPICNDVGEVIAFSGRILTGDTETAKYLNSPETPLFRKGSILFGLHKTKRGLIEAECAIVCEGQLDLITLFEAGLTNVVAPQGTAFTESQARILKRYVSEVVLCFDADAAGQKAAERSLEPLLENDLVVRVAEMPPGEDPDSLVRKEGAEKFGARIAGARDFFDFWIEREVSTSEPFQPERQDAARPAAGRNCRACARPADAERGGQQGCCPPRGGSGGFRKSSAQAAAKPDSVERRRAPWRLRPGTRSPCSACWRCAMSMRTIFC